ncbi:MAG: DUF4956 domain-containing protein [Bacteroidales bacterium]|nr:DUF4956 domain-containing protein [Bacteroidales bacterium]
MIFLETIPEFFGIKLIDAEDFFELLIRFGFNMLMVVLVVRYLYYPITRRKDYLFSYMLISVIVFLLCYLLENVKLELGFALGLFAIFGILRYRTDAIPIKEMTYLFVVIGISVINALANKKVSYSELVFTNISIVFIVFLLEKVFLLRHESCKTISYEKIDLIKPEKREELLKDLKERTGININRIEIGKIDFLRDTARINIYFYESENQPSYLDDGYSGSRINDDDDD